MATAFPIGVSSQPINIAGAGVNFMRSAVDAKLREIEQNREEIGENAKNALKAMSISTIEGLSGSIRDRYQGEIENYRNTVIDKFRNSGGKLSLQQQKEIQDGFVDLTKRMQGDVTSLKKMEEVQKLYLANPYAYQESLPQELRSMQLDLEKGKAIEDPMLLPLKNAVPISTSDYVLKKYAAPIKNLNIETKAGFTGNIFSETETRGMGVVDPASRQKAIDLRDEIMRDSWVKYRAGEIDSETYNREKKTVEDAINQVISQSKPFRQTTGRSGSGTTKPVYDFSPREVTMGEESFNIVDVPDFIPQPERVQVVSNATNLSTGQKVDGSFQAEMTGIDWDKKVAIYRGLGNVVANNGKPLYVPAGSSSTPDEAKANGITEDGLTDEVIKTRLKNSFKSKGNKQSVKDVNNVRKTKDENGNIVISGDIVTKGGLFSSSEEIPFAVTYETFIDPKAKADFSVPLRKEMVTKWFGKTRVDGVPVEQYFDRQTTKESDVKLSTEQESAVSSLMKNNGWNRQQTIKWLKDNGYL